ncbi:prenyltransferase [bacterium]|nr:prenyltransferase [bacterium]
MDRSQPRFSMMIRAPFLSSIISPMLIGTFAGIYARDGFNPVNFILVMITGICLHIATNVYNDIYDTIQGTDRINVHRNEFSGGSGVLLDFPGQMNRMYMIARTALVTALVTSLLLVLRVAPPLRIIIILLYGFSAFFSKYYTAAPVKLAYRGLGEVSVWFAFGPMAILMAAAAQGAAFHPVVIAAMPISGISTLSILLIGQMIDLDADAATGKRGISARLGNRTTAAVYLAIQILLCLNVIILGLFFFERGWPLLLSLVPYLIFLPKATRLLLGGYDTPEALKSAAGFNVKLHLLFSGMLNAGLLITVLRNGSL